MKHRQETDLGTEMLGVEGNLQKSFGARPKQQVVEELLVLQQEWRELVGQGKDHVKVVDREQFFLASSEPTLTGCHLTFWAMPIATGVENEGTMATTGTLIAMSTQDRGTAVCDSTEHFLVRPVNPAAVIGEESFALRPYDVGHF
ncbi:MAG: hypothetical protein WBV26_05355 [Candidatus Sulfotelmatobacter sp.]|jgi:hypothetical protein